ncbi:hypothetical protein [Pantoea sp. LMR881]|uniref:hypothetical protein n=1 Tax=Pantoea sp. LMR881 TaxID=3014336 RepID=UPI003FA6DFA7
MTHDLRHKCQIPITVTDEQLRTRFLDSTYNNAAVLSAVKMQQLYQTSLSQIKCPE